MKRTLAMTLIAASATPSLAQSLADYDFRASLSYQKYDGDVSTLTHTHIDGSLGLSFGQVVTQFDASSFLLSNNNVNYTSYGLHLGYEITPGLVVGGFYVIEHQTVDFRMTGVEAVYAIPAESALPVTLEGYYSRFDSDQSTYAFDVFSIAARTMVNDDLTLSAGYTKTTGDIELALWRAGGSYAIGDLDFGVEAIRYPEFDGTVFGLSLTYHFGERPVFGTRGYKEAIPSF